MASNLKIILSAVSVAALLASPAAAKTQRHQQTAPALVNVPADARASFAPNASVVTVYSPDVRVQAYPMHGVNPDFQLGSEN